MHHICPTDLYHTDGGCYVPLELIPTLTSVLHFNQTGTWNMASIFMPHVTYLICAFVLVSSASWSHENCTEPRDIPPCNYTFSQIESNGYMSISLLFENKTTADKCEFGAFITPIATIDIYQSLTLWCSKNAPRIIYDGWDILARSVHIKNCEIYWKTPHNLLIKKLILDDVVDEFWTGERQDFYQCTMSSLNEETIARNLRSIVNFRLLSSVVRPISQVFIRYAWPNVRVISVKG